MSSQANQANQATSFDPVEVREYARQDLNFFAGIVMPDVATKAFPPFYHWIWQKLITSAITIEDFSKIALGLPRGHGKTMLIKLFMVWCILYSPKHYILVIGANISKARAIISDVGDCLDEYNVQKVYGNWRQTLEQDTADLKKFNFTGGAKILHAAGWGSAIRGSNEKLHRPDLIIFDDAQTKECAESINESESFHSWFVGTALKVKSPDGCTIVYIGNMYKDIYLDKAANTYCCMLRNLQKSPEWLSLIVGAILSDGTALWEQLHPMSRLLADFRSDISLNRMDVFLCEVQNDPSSVISRHIDVKLLSPYIPLPGERHQGSFIVIDPATSKLTPDQLVISYFEIYDDVPVLVEMFNGKLTSPETVFYAIEMALRLGCTLIVVESVAYQYELCNWFIYVCEQRGIEGITIQDLNAGRTHKNGRILKMFQAWQKQEVRTSESTHNRCLSQATNFNPQKTDNLDDILDCLEMATRIVSEYRHLIALDHYNDEYSQPINLIPIEQPTNF